MANERTVPVQGAREFRPGLIELHALAIWFALAASALELAAMGFRTLVLGQLIYRAGTHLLWMIPAANALTFAIPALMLAAIARLWPSAVTPRLALSAFAGLAALAAFLLVERYLHWAALLLLAAGTGLQAGTMLAPRYDALKRWRRWTLPVGCVAVLASAIAIPTARHLTETRRLGALPESPAGAPNIVLIILDTMRWMSLSMAESSLHTTPNLARLAQRGVLFDRAVAPAPWTLPSHASIFTGLWGAQLNKFLRHGKGLQEERTTLAETLEANGYASAGFSANRVVNRSSGLAQGFLHFEAFKQSIPQILYTPNILRWLFHSNIVHRVFDYYDVPGRKSAPELQENFLDWMDGHRQNRPVFAFLNYFDVHAPYLPPAPFDTLFDPHGAQRTPILLDLLNTRATDSATTRSELEAYLGAVAYLDSKLGVLFEEMRRRGLLDNTVIVIAGDHGEEFGEHGKFGHGHTLYTELISVPLLIIAPGRVPAGVRVESPVSLVDLPSTILDLAGVQQGELGGKSLRKFWESGAPPGPVWSDGANRVSVIEGRFHYILGPGSQEQLFDNLARPGEHENLAGDSAQVSELQHMRSLGHTTAANRR